MKEKVPAGVKVIIGFHFLCAVAWTIGQGGAVLFYDTVAGWGLQDPRESLDPVLVENNRGMGLTDFLIQIPLFILAIAGLWRMRFFGAVASWMIFGISLYWPMSYWSTQYFFREAGVRYVPAEAAPHILLAFIFIFSVWGTWYLFRKRTRFT